jgi:hypothetical protein
MWVPTYVGAGPLNMAGVYLRTSAILMPKSDFFKQVLQFEKIFHGNFKYMAGILAASF